GEPPCERMPTPSGPVSEPWRTACRPRPSRRPSPRTPPLSSAGPSRPAPTTATRAPPPRRGAAPSCRSSAARGSASGGRSSATRLRCGVVARSPDGLLTAHALWHGLRTVPRPPTEGLPGGPPAETFGQARWHGPETVPQRGTTTRPSARSPRPMNRFSRSVVMAFSWFPRRAERPPQSPRRRRLQPLRVEALEHRQLLSTFTVLNTLDAGAGSLRQAILDANANPGADQIAFAIAPGGAQTIRPTSALPAITDPVTLDGTTQPGFAEAGHPVIELNGGLAAAGANGLTIFADDCTVRGLVINGFAGTGTDLNGIGIGLGPGSSNNGIEGNFLGTDVSGTEARPNFFGVLVVEGSANRIGGPTAAARDVISGNLSSAVVFLEGTGNVVQGNLIGTDLT